ncbi:MAG TPA: DUF2062 domain-containing protein [Calidithermus sp.]|nr:DUF2062 domain-containing protein [Calidithermus sp.]
MMRRLAARLREVLHLDDPAPRLALALAVGVFIGCTPFWGLQTVLAVTVALLFRLNRVATVAGAWLNLPWVAPFVYGAALQVGTAIVPDPSGSRGPGLAGLLRHPGQIGWGQVRALLADLSLPLLIGCAVVGAGAAAVTYVVALRLITARRRARGAVSGRSA